MSLVTEWIWNRIRLVSGSEQSNARKGQMKTVKDMKDYLLKVVLRFNQASPTNDVNTLM